MAKTIAKPAAETRRFSMHPKLLLDVIQRQAGSLAKAIIEGVMNAADAGATRCAVSITDERVGIGDNGRGITERREVEEFFEVFGQPHSEKEGKKFGTFRMGRGQMFAFGANVWQTGPFEMRIDVQEKGLDYVLAPLSEPVSGCTIDIRLYSKLKPSDIAETERAIRKWVKYAPIEVTVNGEVASVDPATEKWTHETDDAWIRLAGESGPLSIYNLGIHTMDMAGYQLGTGGTVVSKRQLKVNFARNDIQSDCPVWRRVKPLIDQKAREKIASTPDLTDSQRQRMCDLVAQGDPPPDAKKMKLFTTSSGKHVSAEVLLRERYKYNNRYTHCPRGDRRGDKVHQQKIAYVLSTESVTRFGTSDLAKVMVMANKLACGQGWYPSRHDDDGIQVVPFESVAGSINTGHRILADADLNLVERLWIELANRSAGTLIDFRNRQDYRAKVRKIVAGESDVANGWTDGLSYVAINRKFLKALTLDNRGLTDLGTLLAHELCHDGPDTGSHIHSLEFYEEFHDLVRLKLPDFIMGAAQRLPVVMKSVGKAVPKQTLRDQDRAFAARRSLEELLEKTQVAADVG